VVRVYFSMTKGSWEKSGAGAAVFGADGCGGFAKGAGAGCCGCAVLEDERKSAHSRIEKLRIIQTPKMATRDEFSCVSGVGKAREERLVSN